MQSESHSVYSTAGHAKKLEPIIHSLDRYDHDPTAWKPVRDQVDRLQGTFELLMNRVDANTHEHQALQRLHDMCFETIRMQTDLFHEHRRVCVAALRLKTHTPASLPAAPAPTGCPLVARSTEARVEPCQRR